MSRLQLILLGCFHFVFISVSQVFIFNNFHLLGYINPMIYVWFILMLPYKTPNWAVLLLSFAMGLTIDVLSFGQGFHAAILTLIGLLRLFLLNLYVGNRDVTFWQRPTLSDIGFAQFVSYVSILVFIHHFFYFALEMFRPAEVLPFLIRVILSSLATISVILICDITFMRPRE